MRFHLVDKVERIDAARIVAVKHVTLAEEYLADHFPTFPVLPGVLMLEAAVQSAGWLMHFRERFSRSMAVLKDARNVKYGHFVAPGQALHIECEWLRETSFKAAGTVQKTDGTTATAFTARLELGYFNLGERHPELAALDAPLIEHARRRWALIAPPTLETVTARKDQPTWA